MIQCSFEKEIELPNGGFRHTKCINKAEILVTSDPCFGLCYHCAYKKLAEQVKKRKGLKFPFAEPDDEDRKIVSMIEFQDSVLVATQKGVYKLVDDKMVRLEIVEEKE